MTEKAQNQIEKINNLKQENESKTSEIEYLSKKLDQEPENNPKEI